MTNAPVVSGWKPSTRSLAGTATATATDTVTALDPVSWKPSPRSLRVVEAALAVTAAALHVVRWKPSTRSRSLRGISALSAPPARIVARAATELHASASRPSSPPGISLRRGAFDRSTLNQPIQRCTSRQPVQRSTSNQPVRRCVPGGLKGRGPLALVQSPPGPLSARAVPRARICPGATASGARAFSSLR